MGPNIISSCKKNVEHQDKLWEKQKTTQQKQKHFILEQDSTL